MTLSTRSTMSHVTGQVPMTKRRAATRDRLLAAAQEVFAERGFNGASVEDICDRAQFTRGAFYSNFSSKDELVLQLSARYQDRLLAGIAEIAGHDDLEPADIVHAVLDTWTTDRRDREMWFLLQSEFTLHAIRDKAVGRVWARQQANVRDGLARLIDEICAARGLTLTVSPQELARLAMALFSAGTSQHLLEPRKVPHGSLVATFLPLILDAAVTEER